VRPTTSPRRGSFLNSTVNELSKLFLAVCGRRSTQHKRPAERESNARTNVQTRTAQASTFCSPDSTTATCCIHAARRTTCLHVNSLCVCCPLSIYDEFVVQQGHNKSQQVEFGHKQSNNDDDDENERNCGQVGVNETTAYDTQPRRHINC